MTPRQHYYYYYYYAAAMAGLLAQRPLRGGALTDAEIEHWAETAWRIAAIMERVTGER